MLVKFMEMNPMGFQIRKNITVPQQIQRFQEETFGKGLSFPAFLRGQNNKPKVNFSGTKVVIRQHIYGENLGSPS